jgi:hypothetical protein
MDEIAGQPAPMTASSASPTPTVGYDREAVYTALTDFDGEPDDEFQAGLQTIVQPMRDAGAAPEQIAETARRAKVFFWSQRTGNAVDYPDYIAWLSARCASTSDAPTTSAHTTDNANSATDTQKEPYPASFNSIVELITTGKTDQIPGIRDIPLKINPEPPSAAKLPRPQKPWERAITEQSPVLDAPAPSVAQPHP